MYSRLPDGQALELLRHRGGASRRRSLWVAGHAEPSSVIEWVGTCRVWFGTFDRAPAVRNAEPDTDRRLVKGCVCPDAAGEPPPLPLDGDRVALGVTGGTAGTTGTVVGMKLDDYCKKGITGTWVGIWQNAEEWGGATGGFTLKVVQKGTSFSGTVDVTGPTCVRHGTVTGTVSKEGNVSMGWVAAGVRDVQFDGTLKGDAMSGTWTAISCAPQSISIWGDWSAQRQK